MGNLMMPNKQELNLVSQFIKNNRGRTTVIVISYNRAEFMRHAKVLGLREVTV